MTGGTDRWVRVTTTGCVGLLALIAATVSYLHMHMLVEVHGQPGWVAVLMPFCGLLSRGPDARQPADDVGLLEEAVLHDFLGRREWPE